MKKNSTGIKLGNYRYITSHEENDKGIVKYRVSMECTATKRTQNNTRSCIICTNETIHMHIYAHFHSFTILTVPI